MRYQFIQASAYAQAYERTHYPIHLVEPHDFHEQRARHFLGQSREQ